jgi:hypothetical protein
MLRRHLRLLIVWFGLLAIVVPSMTCVAAASRGDCCPAEGTPPCGECPDKRAPRAPVKAHCAVRPVQAVASAVVTLVSAEQGLSPDALDIIPAFDSPTVHTCSNAGSALYLDNAVIAVGDAATTYLVTGRLRL